MSQTRGPYGFSWDQIKKDKERENYLGECMFTSANRWNTASQRDITDDEAKRIEKEMMDEALGLIPKKPKTSCIINGEKRKREEGHSQNPRAGSSPPHEDSDEWVEAKPKKRKEEKKEHKHKHKRHHHKHKKSEKK